jgi:hypothetical protein
MGKLGTETVVTAPMNLGSNHDLDLWVSARHNMSALVSSIMKPESMRQSRGPKPYVTAKRGCWDSDSQLVSSRGAWVGARDVILSVRTSAAPGQQHEQGLHRHDSATDGSSCLRSHPAKRMQGLLQPCHRPDVL